MTRGDSFYPPAPLGFRRPLDAAIDWLGPTNVTGAKRLAVTAARADGGIWMWPLPESDEADADRARHIDTPSP